MILQYSFRKSFLISSPPLKPDQQPIQQLLPPQIPPSSLVRTYSFSQLKQNDSFKQQFNDSSIELPRNPKLMDQMELKIEQLKNQLKKQKDKRLKITQEHKTLDEKYQAIVKAAKDKEKQDTIKQDKRQFAKKITSLQQEISILKGEIAQKAQQLITYESRSEQSRRLLQKLNQNINKKQSKLIKDKEAIIKEFQETKRLLEQSRLTGEHTQKQLKQTKEKIQQMVQRRQQQLSNKFQDQMNSFKRDYESRLNEKDRQVKELNEKLSQTKALYQDQLRQMRQSIDQEQLIKFGTQSLISELKQQIAAKDQSIQKLVHHNKELFSTVENLKSKLQQTQTQTSNIRQSQNSRINKLQIQIANFQYEAKQNQQKISFLEDETQRMNVLVNQLKQDKRLLNKQKQQLRTQINQKSLQIETLRNKLEQIKQNQIKYSSIIENYEKQQQRFYDQQGRQTSTLASLQIKVKANAIDIQKLNLRLSQKQQELNKSLKDLEKYKKLYKTQHQTLEMYKQQTHFTRQKTQQKWKQLKDFYQNQISLLQQRISNYDSANASDSRLKIRNLMTYEKARINSSRLSISRGTPKSIEKQDTINIAIKKRLLYKTNDPDTQLKQNYWQGLNNDYVQHSEEHAHKK